jgi:hypothetical protein
MGIVLGTIRQLSNVGDMKWLRFEGHREAQMYFGKKECQDEKKAGAPLIQLLWTSAISPSVSGWITCLARPVATAAAFPAAFSTSTTFSTTAAAFPHFTDLFLKK